MRDPLTDKLYELNEEEVANLYKNLFDTEEGKLVLEDLRNRCYVKTTTGDDNSHRMAFREGMRVVVLHIETQLNYEPKKEVEGDAAT